VVAIKSKDRSPLYHSVFVVHEHSSVDTLANLNAATVHRMLFGVDSHSTSTHIVPRIVLLEKGLQDAADSKDYFAAKDMLSMIAKSQPVDGIVGVISSDGWATAAAKGWTRGLRKVVIGDVPIPYDPVVAAGRWNRIPQVDQEELLNALSQSTLRYEDWSSRYRVFRTYVGSGVMVGGSRGTGAVLLPPGEQDILDISSLLDDFKKHRANLVTFLVEQGSSDYPLVTRVIGRAVVQKDQGDVVPNRARLTNIEWQGGARPDQRIHVLLADGTGRVE
jgi:hypothetical protein